MIVSPGGPASLLCEAAGPAAPWCRWLSPTGCCYGDGCAQTSQDCRSAGWRLEREEREEREEDTGGGGGGEGGCVLSLTEVEREEGGDWECEQGQGKVTVALTVLARGSLDWLGENLRGWRGNIINTR